MYGFIAPTEITDEYPVIDPLYGVDGFRNVDTLNDLNNIPNLRRRAGMVVGVSGGTQYYKLNPQPWNGTITDWDTFSLGGGTFTGGTVTGDTIFTQGVTATTFSASTYLGLPLDVYTTGLTFNPSTYDISIERNDGVTLTQNLGILATDVTITGGTYDPLNGSITFINNTGGTFTVSGFITGFTDVQVTGYTYQDNTFTIFDSSGNTFSTTIDVMTGLTINGILSANTLTVNGVNITGDTYTTGGTYSNGVLDFYNNNGGGYQITGLYTGQTSYVNSLTTGVGLSGDSTTGNITIINMDPDQVVSISGGTGILTGGTYPNFTIENTLPDQTVVLNNGTNINVTGTYPNFTIDVTGLTDNNTYTTGFTYNNNTFTISDNSGFTYNATIDVMTGLTINGDIEMGNTSSRKIFSESVSEISSIQYATSGTSVQMRWDGSGNSTVFNVNNTDFVSMTSNKLGFGGIIYGSDYSPYYTDRSLIDLGYFNSNNRYVTGGTYNFTGDTLTLERNDGNQVQITGFTYERQSDYVYPYFYGGSASLYTLTSTPTWVIKRVDYTTPGSPITQQAIGSWDNRYTLIYT